MGNIFSITPAPDTSAATADIHDRVAEAYYGTLGAPFMRETQRRVHWICGQVQGARVLDAGCSQGIVPILLAREGKRVAGVDISVRAIEEAGRFLQQEPPHVQTQIRWINGDFLRHDFADERFDTVVMSEVLEHLVQPRQFIERAAALLGEKGRLVVTVPFGINDFADHKHTYYMLEPYRMLSAHFDITEVAVLGKWLGLVGTKRAAAKPSAPAAAGWNTELLAQLEQAFYALERELQDEQAALRARLSEANLKYRSVTEQMAALKQQLAEKTQAQQAAEQQETQAAGASQLKLVQVTAERDSLFDRLQDAHALEHTAGERTRALEARVEQYREEAFAAEKRALAQEAAGEALRLRLHEANVKYRTATEQVADYKHRLAHAEAEGAALQEKNAALQAEIIATEHAISAGMQEREALERRHAEQTARADAAEKRHAAVEQARDALEARMREEAARFSSELSTLKAVTCDKEHSIRQLELEAFTAKQALAAANAQIDQLRQQKLAAEYQAQKIRATLSFQLGYQLIHGFASFRAFRALPGALWAIRKEAQRRRAQKQAASGACAPARPKQAVPPPLAAQDQPHAQALARMRMACVMDEFTFRSFAPECNLLQLTPHSWQQELEAFTPDLLFIESAWRGKDDLWGNKVAQRSPELAAILAWCKARGIPTVFWNKEDPVHFSTLLNTATLFDHVFTTDIDCIPRYRRMLGHANVHLLPFACQPALTNPIERYERKDAFCFAGAYYARYPERTRDLGHFIGQLAPWKPVEIYDRNFGKEDPAYCFPEEYRPFIVGHLPFGEIDKAYKGYRYAISLNSVKQSQSMFARRVFELLACNTVTVSNYSRGVRLLLGDLVVCSDSAPEILARLQRASEDETTARKFRLAGLRKVMREHTYQDRLAYVLSKVRRTPPPCLLPAVAVTAYAKHRQQFEMILANYRRQDYAGKSLLVIVPEQACVPEGFEGGPDVRIVQAKDMWDLTLEQAVAGDYIAAMVPDDYYGPHYLLDLALATRYSDAAVIGKKAHYLWSAKAGLALVDDGSQYRSTDALPVRAALLKRAAIAALPLREWLATPYTRQMEDAAALAIDAFNYCKNGADAAFLETHTDAVDDLPGLDGGVALEALLAVADRPAPDESAQRDCPVLCGSELAAHFPPQPHEALAFAATGPALHITSALPEGQHAYAYATRDWRPQELGADGSLMRLHLDVTPGLNVQLAVLFLDAKKQRIGHAVRTANTNHEAGIPLDTAWIRLGLRLSGPGTACVHALAFDHRRQQRHVLLRGRTLVLTNYYPSYDDLYRNGFVHRRVAAYAAAGRKLPVFCMRGVENMACHEFENIDVTTGDREALHTLLATGQHTTLLVHFLDEGMWEVLRRHLDRIRLRVWVHGSEIQAWHRRAYNYDTEEERARARTQSDRRLAFWRSLLKQQHPNLKLIFVSEHLARESMADLGLTLAPEQYTVIHNPIDTELFAYREKTADARRKILSIRSFHSRTYANDLSVKAILALAEAPYFNALSFHLIGDGPLFDETLAPLRSFKNVLLERRFLTQGEIARRHREYGVFLCPTRMDSQGVSRDEAMASGLVPVTSRVAAIPEFVDAACGIVAEPEDAQGLAQGIRTLYEDPALFLRLSRAGALRVKEQRGAEHIIPAEMALFAEGI